MAGRPRTPTNILKLRGTDKNTPARMRERANEPQNKNPVGKPQTWLTAAEKRAWRMLEKECITGVLGEADRFALAMAAQLAAKCINHTATPADKTLMHRYLGQFGMTPSERSRIAIPKEKPKNKFDD